MTAIDTPAGARAVTADLHARVERYLTPSPGDRFRGSVVMHEVPHEELPRRADVIALNFYAGRPPIVGVEIKATRADWLNELADQAKAQAWAEHCNEWWIAALPGDVLVGELPPGWGLLNPHRKTTMIARVPAQTREQPTVPTWLLTAAAKKIDSERVAETARAVNRALARSETEIARDRARTADAGDAAARERDAEDAQILRALLTAAGINRRPWGLLNDPPSSPEGRALLAAADGLVRLHAEREAAERVLRGIAGDLDRAQAAITRAMAVANRDTPERPGLGG